MAILVALILGIASSSSTNSDGSSSGTTSTLHVASTVLFLVVTVLQAIQTIYLASKRVSGTFNRLLLAKRENSSSFKGQNKYYKEGKNSIGVKYGNYILLVISLLLIIRETFATATVNNSAKQDSEPFWYPFLAVTEFLVVVLFSTPGLVPRGDEVPEYALADVTPQSYATTRPYATSAPYATDNTPYATNPQYATADTPYATNPPYATNFESPYATPPFAASHAAPVRYGA